MIHRALTLCAAVLLSAAFARDGLDRWIERTELPPVMQAVSAEVVDRNGRLLRAYPVENGRWRLATGPGDVDSLYLDMLIAVEDKRFYTHAGVDPWALLRAAGQAIKNGRIVSGGSTLTMQAARLIENSGTGGWRGKLRQMRVALALERRLSKDDILALYLTHAPFGGNVEGARAASYAWFDKPVGRLSAAEAALLVSLPQSPELRRPDRNPEQAMTARNRLLAQFNLPGQSADVPTKLRRPRAVAAHLTDLARRDASTAHALTIDAHVQLKMEHLARDAVRNLPAEVSAAILVADHHSGALQAYVGAAEYGKSAQSGYVDMVQAVRSPGSTLKPVIYALAFDQGLAHPETLIADRPVAFGTYAPQNFDGVFRGDVSVRRALELSLNIPPVLLTDTMGPHRLMAALRRGGATPQVAGGKAGLAVALGGIGLSLYDLVQIYAGLAQGGTAPQLHWDAAQETKPMQTLVSPAAAWHVGHILGGIQPPTGAPVGHVAFKTGTSYGHRDAWAIGWDGQHVIGVWMGRPDGTPVPGIFGGDVAAPILFEAFSRLKPALSPLPPPPKTVILQPNALLPKALQRFDPRERRLEPARVGVEVAFPPDGARFRDASGQGVLLKLQGGVPPFAVLRNGVPSQTGVVSRQLIMTSFGRGYSSVTVVDAGGTSDRVTIWVD